MRQLIRPVILLSFVGLPVSSLHAHTYPYSTLELRVEATGLRGMLETHLDSLAAMGVPYARLTGDPVNEALLKRRLAPMIRPSRGRGLAVRPEGGRPLAIEVMGIAIDRNQKTVRIQLRIPWDQPPSRIDFQCQLFQEGEAAHQTYLRLTDGGYLAQNLFTHFAPRFTYWLGHPQAKVAVFRTYLQDGTHHIVVGYDHIAFLLGLLLLGGTIKQLAKIVSAFTIAHSVTLSLAALDIVRLSSSFVEPAIALSIMYIGADNLVAMPRKAGPEETPRKARDWRAWLAFFFGFIHGFGFAGVLRETGLPQHALGLSLFSFNAGVEVGQLAIVLIATPALGWIRRCGESSQRRLVSGGSWLVLVAGTYWFVERMFL